LVIFYAITSRSDDLPGDFRRFSGFFGRTSPLGFAPFFRVAKVRRDMLATGLSLDVLTVCFNKHNEVFHFFAWWIADAGRQFSLWPLVALAVVLQPRLVG
jgi:hypothetical protein